MILIAFRPFSCCQCPARQARHASIASSRYVVSVADHDFETNLTALPAYLLRRSAPP